jgi:[acyl-carrier-protein] S-malonyltransferase
MVFPGQGSQSVGMMQAYGDLPAMGAVIFQASQELGIDMAKMIAEGPAETLNSTVNTQPVMVTAGYAVYRAWRELGGPEPDVVAGHSLGEYTALVVAEAISFADCLPLVRLRAEAMQEAVPAGLGGMAAILGLEDDALKAACVEAAQGEIVDAVNFNAPGQTVIAGHATAVQRAIEAAKARGAKRAIPLPVSAPFHSALMAPAAAQLCKYLETVNIVSPRIRVLHNLDVKMHGDAAGIRQALVGQADHAVRWVEIIRAMAALGVTHVLECGPGKVLAGLNKRIDPGLTGMALSDRAGIDAALAALNG